MSREESSHISGLQVLEPGVTVGGVQLRDRIARDSFSSVWLTESLGGDYPDTCIRIIPSGNFRTTDAHSRFSSELEFWQNMRGVRVVELFEHGRDHGYYYMLMRHIEAGSLEDRFERGETWGKRAIDLALAFAAALRDLHGNGRAHGCLKPANVFVESEGRAVLLSDFLIPLWLDEIEDEGSPLRAHLLHSYRAPEQRRDPQCCDMRSDVYSWGLIVTRCVSGTAPTLDGRIPKNLQAPWPKGLAQVVEICLEADMYRRYADGYELLAALEDATTDYASPRAGPEEGEQERQEAADQQGAAAEPEPQPDVAELIDAARFKVEQGDLEGALELVEHLAPKSDGLQQLLDGIEDRHRKCAQLCDEAVRLAEMGHCEAALETAGEAAGLWNRSPRVATIRAELEKGNTERGELRSGEAATPLRAALDAGNYEAARPLLERFLREGAMTDELRAAVREFKHGRVRKSFLTDIAKARRLYALGHRQDAAECWREASRWLPDGPERERLRAIADAARAGRLELKLLEMPKEDSGSPPTPTEHKGPDELPREIQERLDAIAAEKKAKVREPLSKGCLVGIGLLIGILAFVILWIVAPLLGYGQQPGGAANEVQATNAE